MKKILFCIYLLVFSISASDNNNPHYGKKFIAGFGQGIVAVPLTPPALFLGGIILLAGFPNIALEKIERLGKWANGTSAQKENIKQQGIKETEKTLIPWTLADKAQAAGFISSYVPLGLFVLRFCAKL